MSSELAGCKFQSAFRCVRHRIHSHSSQNCRCVGVSGSHGQLTPAQRVWANLNLTFVIILCLQLYLRAPSPAGGSSAPSNSTSRRVRTGNAIQNGFSQPASRHPKATSIGARVATPFPKRISRFGRGVSADVATRVSADTARSVSAASEEGETSLPAVTRHQTFRSILATLPENDRATWLSVVITFPAL